MEGLLSLLAKVARSKSAMFFYVVFGGVLIYQVWLAATASSRVQEGLYERIADNGPVSARIILPFPPERFHITKIQQWARIRRVKDNAVELRALNENALRNLSERFYWITRIELVDEAPPKSPG